MVTFMLPSLARCRYHSPWLLEIAAMIGASVLLSQFVPVSMAEEGDQSTPPQSARTRLESLSRLAGKLSSGAESLSDRFALEMETLTPARVDGKRDSIRLSLESHGSDVSCVVLYPDDVVYAVFFNDQQAFTSRVSEQIEVSEGRTFGFLLPAKEGGFRFSFHQPPDHRSSPSGPPRPASLIAVDFNYLCGMFCTPETDVAWGDHPREIVMTKKTDPLRKARLVLNAEGDATEFPIASISWDAKSGYRYSVANIRIGDNARRRNHRVAPSRLRRENARIVGESLTLGQLTQRWTKMAEGEILTEPQKALGEQLHKMWIDDETQDVKK